MGYLEGCVPSFGFYSCFGICPTEDLCLSLLSRIVVLTKSGSLSSGSIYNLNILGHVDL